LKKSSKKLFLVVWFWLDEHPTAVKSFLLLFFKKEGLPSSLLANLSP
jgi:hypothetical protein